MLLYVALYARSWKVTFLSRVFELTLLILIYINITYSDLMCVNLPLLLSQFYHQDSSLSLRHSLSSLVPEKKKINK